MIEIPYATVDVFTTDQFGGNQLAVITDARGLSGAQMQKIANEFNYSETTFVLPASAAENTAQIRIFTSLQEVPFAGHPNVGTAFVLGRQQEIFGAQPGGRMRFEEEAGLVEVELIEEDGAVEGAIIKAPQPLEIGRTIDSSIVARCIGIDPSDIVRTHHEPRELSVGLRFTFAEVGLSSLSKAYPRYDAFMEASSLHGRADLTGRLSIFAYARLGEGYDRLQARMFAPLSGTFEDPATGSASAALGAYLASLDPRPDGDIRIDIAQGVEMGRPSAIALSIVKTEGRVEEVRISGRCAAVMRGILTLD